MAYSTLHVKCYSIFKFQYKETNRVHDSKHTFKWRLRNILAPDVNGREKQA